MIDRPKQSYPEFPKEERFSKKEITQKSVEMIDKQLEQWWVVRKNESAQQ